MEIQGKQLQEIFMSNLFLYISHHLSVTLGIYWRQTLMALSGMSFSATASLTYVALFDGSSFYNADILE
jgi:hypothetical protein